MCLLTSSLCGWVVFSHEFPVLGSLCRRYQRQIPRNTWQTCKRPTVKQVAVTVQIISHLYPIKSHGISLNNSHEQWDRAQYYAHPEFIWRNTATHNMQVATFIPTYLDQSSHYTLWYCLYWLICSSLYWLYYQGMSSRSWSSTNLQEAKCNLMDILQRQNTFTTYDALTFMSSRINSDKIRKSPSVLSQGVAKPQTTNH